MIRYSIYGESVGYVIIKIQESNAEPDIAFVTRDE